MKSRVLNRKKLCEDLLKESERRLQEKKGWEKQEDYLQWKAWSIQKICKRLEMTPKEAEIEFDFFDLCMGPEHTFVRTGNF